MAKKTTKKKAPKRSSSSKPGAKKTAKKTTAKKTTVKKKATKKTPTKTPTKTTKKAPAKKRVKKIDPEVKVDRRTMAKEEDRRSDEDRRQAVAPIENERREAPERRNKVARRRQIDPTTCERDYTNVEIEFMHALDEYKRKAGRMFPTCSEILEVVRDLGYRRLTPEEVAVLAPLNPAPEAAATAENDNDMSKDVEPFTSDANENVPLFGESADGFAAPGLEVNDLAVSDASLQDFEA